MARTTVNQCRRVSGDYGTILLVQFNAKAKREGFTPILPLEPVQLLIVPQAQAGYYKE